MTSPTVWRRPLLLMLLPCLLAAQGVTTAAIQGRVLDEDGSPIPGATVRVTNVANGRRWEIATRSNGAYLVEVVGVGGPYRIDARALGFAPEGRSGIVLALGQRGVADFVLRRAVTTLAPVEVMATTDAVLSPGRTGPAEFVSRARIADLPNLGRDFLALTMLSPHTGSTPSSGAAGAGGITIAGQNRLYNSFQIDGGVNHDLYRGRLPGRETLPRPISLEALEGIQILPAPFDVRHAGFTGGLVNAVTKSGTNAVHGSLFGVRSDAALTGRNSTGDAAGSFTTWQHGATVGGPIIRDRVHYFLSVDLRDQVVPDPGPLITDTAAGADLARIGISRASAERFATLLRDSLGLEPGTLGPVSGRARAHDVFGKLSVRLGTNSHLESSHHYAYGDRTGFITRTPTFYSLSSIDQRNPSTINASRLIWTALLRGRWSNELIVSRLHLDDSCQPNADFPQLRVAADRGTLVAGALGGSCPVRPLNAVRQDVFEVTESLTGAAGDHILSLGVHGEALRFRDELLQNSSGQWTFFNLDSLQARRATRYLRALPGTGYAGALEVRAREFGAYIQDRWTATRGLTVTLGLRADVPVLPDAVATNDALRVALGIDTGRLPGANVRWSPRLGVNYDWRAEGTTFIRGGIGLFGGRPPYQWLTNAYRDQGTRELFLDCRAQAQVPAFDPATQPDVCADGTRPVPRLSYFDPDTRFPQNMKFALGVDQRLPGGFVGTVEMLFTRAVRQLYLTDANLRSPVGVSAGEGNRQLYGTIIGTNATPARPVGTLDRVVRVSNRSGDRAHTLAVQLRRHFADIIEGSAFYGFTRARDLMSVTNPSARANLENTPLNGTLEARELRTSYFEIPHRMHLGATVRLPFRARLSVLYAGASGTPYTHVIDGDANADGIGAVPLFNDIVYVPRNRADISIDGNGRDAGVGTAAKQDSVYALFNDLIESEPCMRRQRGRILQRNSCRNPWFSSVNARFTKEIPTVAGQTLELTADLYNVANLINRRWGQYRVTIPDPWVQTLRLRGYDVAAGRGIYEYIFRGLASVKDLESRWQMELSVRYLF